jgi:hypothetical protein
MEKVIIVYLRCPSSRADLRHDPFWEFGSFGITGCHADNLLHPNTSHELNGVRLAFAQGGRLGTRLVFLTPPVKKVVKYRDRSEVLWPRSRMPFRYSDAPVLIDNSGFTHFRLLKRLLVNGSRDSWVGQFASNFRSSKQQLSGTEARELIRVYGRLRKSVRLFASNYVEVLPVKRDPVSSADRVRTYESKLEEAGSERISSSAPRSPGGKRQCSASKHRHC